MIPKAQAIERARLPVGLRRARAGLTSLHHIFCGLHPGRWLAAVGIPRIDVAGADRLAGATERAIDEEGKGAAGRAASFAEDRCAQFAQRTGGEP